MLRLRVRRAKDQEPARVSREQVEDAIVSLARNVFGDLEALLGGAIKLTGDSSKVLALASVLTPPPGGHSSEADAPDLVRDLIRRVDEITEP